MERFVETVPYGAIPHVDVAEGEACYILNGRSGGSWHAEQVKPGTRGKVYPAVLKTTFEVAPDFYGRTAEGNDEEARLEHLLVSAVVGQYPVGFYDHELRVLLIPPDGIVLAVKVWAVPMEPRGPGVPSWVHVLGDYLDKGQPV